MKRKENKRIIKFNDERPSTRRRSRVSIGEASRRGTFPARKKESMKGVVSNDEAWLASECVVCASHVGSTGPSLWRQLGKVAAQLKIVDRYRREKLKKKKKILIIKIYSRLY